MLTEPVELLAAGTTAKPAVTLGGALTPFRNRCRAAPDTFHPPILFTAALYVYRARANKDPARALAEPLDGTHEINVYPRDVGADGAGCDLQSRMFTRHMIEDPATGSATAAVSALGMRIRGVPHGRGGLEVAIGFLAEG